MNEDEALHFQSLQKLIQAGFKWNVHDGKIRVWYGPLIARSTGNMQYFIKDSVVLSSPEEVDAFIKEHPGG